MQQTSSVRPLVIVRNLSIFKIAAVCDVCLFVVRLYVRLFVRLCLVFEWAPAHSDVLRFVVMWPNILWPGFRKYKCRPVIGYSLNPSGPLAPTERHLKFSSSFMKTWMEYRRHRLSSIFLIAGSRRHLGSKKHMLVNHLISQKAYICKSCQSWKPESEWCANYLLIYNDNTHGPGFPFFNVIFRFCFQSCLSMMFRCWSW